MWKRNLWTPLSPILRRRFPSFSPNSTLNIPSSTIFSSPCSSTAQYSRVFWSSSYDFLGSVKFSRKLCSSQSAEQVHVRCWNCKAAAQTTPFLACDSCRSVQPVDPSVDYFQIFGLEKKYELEDNNLEGKYKDWQKKLHPDLVHSKSEEEKEYAAEQSARVIDAYQTLSKPLARAIYVLKLEGVDVDEEQTISDISFLAEWLQWYGGPGGGWSCCLVAELVYTIMEIREAVEEAVNSETLLQIQSQVQEKLKHWSQSFSNAFQSRKFEEAVISVQRMTYYIRVNDEIMKKL
ncbi:iron-sulfur cluster co-chaperone protein HscB homolog isoform X1 [Vitis riparia]|uniref:iron-sulfur cluster co-chaperone protein HscB homolog isoform X1 n=1 Tax=Vitis riparia TaxID=96939 RepID=UPI00155AC37C|nr:iron-sulfur cluster co-chaperone protein HscB homolog isoform X1 [Vitis riparia]XP_034692622.1 iron-sulfur cluster co-chaperone protein HscB homolog isoform X1 [Vitis riparia]